MDPSRSGRDDFISGVTKSADAALSTPEDGIAFEGDYVGTVTTAMGDVVLSMGMTGHVETLTDASYAGQILVLNYPFAGNCGTPAPRSVGSLDKPFESSRISNSSPALDAHLHLYCVVIDGVFEAAPADGVVFHAASGVDAYAVAGAEAGAPATAARVRAPGLSAGR